MDLDTMRERLAFGWLRNLWKGPESPAAKPAHNATSERDLVVALGDDTVELLDTRHGKHLVQRVKALARKHGIDDGYIQHILDRDSENWPSLSGRQREALLALVAVSDAAYAFEYEGRYNLPPIEDEPKVAMILRELGKWAWDHRKPLQRDYAALLRQHAPAARKFLEQSSGESWSDRDAMVWLHGSLKHHINNSPAGIWRSTMLYRVLDLIF